MQFNFPNKDGKPYKSSDRKMVWNEKSKREKPKGWKYMTIGNYSNCKSGYAFKKREYLWFKLVISKRIIP